MTDMSATSEKRYATAGDYVQLLKPRIMMLVVFTAIAGLVAAVGVTGVSINPIMAAIATLAIALGSGAAGAINMWYDADIDQIMSRTSTRPIPSGAVPKEEALAMGLIMSGVSVMLMWLASNWLAAALLAFSIFYYGVIYTMWLKRSTPQNIVIGGAAGALPPVIGWAAVTGNVTVESVVLFMIIFLWTPAHFWALALFKSGDYGKAGIPMMPNVVGEASTKRQMVVYAVLTAISGVLPAVMGFASFAYGAVALLLGAGFVWYSLAVLRMPEGDERMIPAKKLFGFSLLYLAIIFGALLVDAVVPQLLAMVL